MLVEPGSRAAASEGRATLALRSPIDGVVLERHRESEAVVMQGEPLVTVGDTSAIEVIADYLSTDAVRIQPGMRAAVDQWGGGQPLERRRRTRRARGVPQGLGTRRRGTARLGRPAASTSRSTAARALGDGYRVEARVVVWEGHDVVRVPVSALFRRGEGWAVFVDDAGVARERAVTVGHRDGNAAEVLSGVAPGARVITYPPDGVADGTPVRAR